MIKASEFVEAARKLGFEGYTGVPCSFLTPFINYVINDEKLTYISSANEGDALATAAGMVIGGKRAVVMMQNSGLGNAVSPITSLAYIFKIPVLIICTLRGDAEFKDEPQHELMGRITGKLLETMEVPWEFFPHDAGDILPVLAHADNYMRTEHRPYALVMRKGTVAPNALRNKVNTTIESEKLVFINTDIKNNISSRNQALKAIVRLTNPEETVIIATTGYTGRELFACFDRANHFYMVGSMGCASSLGLGLSLARPDLKVVVIDGDGAALMRMGNFATIGAYGGANFIHILLDNEVHDSTGAQSTVSAGVSFAKIAEACGYGAVFAGNDVALIDKLFATSTQNKPLFAHLKIRAGTLDNLPRPNLTATDVLRRLMNYINSSF
ncbi:thiamine pyrophosphate enzyme [Dulcicalothrix desertica PCC 7102]|uniref:Thiamine pyrophosphate enzyme n=1 Tax=Dulcicalothrix desertica PCC 7102 TaxID=232991 RepID=A0A3S1CG14_9CYAN|nr:phosphonopyruvate decarboxylase [Dulcicalothrix desertica]RUT02765.1 thiamine pyrophosphate enzyme [Dulcicalothrix desertica PCC 7102]TWH39000.1 phosphonopyruvate decarboxylase [Dulcicalothrix desertica PCC 7102]